MRFGAVEFLLAVNVHALCVPAFTLSLAAAREPPLRGVLKNCSASGRRDLPSPTHTLVLEGAKHTR